MMLSNHISSNSYAEINLQAFRSNIQTIKQMIGKKTLLAVIKTNAYGHGIEAIAQEAVNAGVDRLGVTTVEEGVLLRQNGIHIPIQLLSSVPSSMAEELVRYNLIASISSFSMANAISHAATRLKKQAIVHLKLNTGLQRFGIEPEDAHAFFHSCYHLPNLKWEGIYTHFSHADERDWSRTESQFQLFENTVTALEKTGYYFPVKHVAASTITLERDDMHLDMVRPGIVLFGYPPNDREKYPTIRPIMTLKTRIMHVRTLQPNSTVGYGGKYRTTAFEKIAVLPIGHGDGYKRALSNKGEVLVRGKRAKIVGTISLDQTFINVTHIPEVKEGDEVVLIGTQVTEEISAYQVANWLDSNVDEVVSSLMHRIPRKYI